MPDNSQPDQVMQAVEKSGKLMRWLQTIIALVIVVAGIGVSWGLNKAEQATLKTQISEMKEATKEEKGLYRSEIDKLKSEVLTLQLGKAASDQVLLGIQSDVGEIKEDVKKLTRNQ